MSIDVEVKSHRDTTGDGGLDIGVFNIPREDLSIYESQFAEGQMTFSLPIKDLDALNAELNKQIYLLYQSDEDALGIAINDPPFDELTIDGSGIVNWDFDSSEARKAKLGGSGGGGLFRHVEIPESATDYTYDYSTKIFTPLMPAGSGVAVRTVATYPTSSPVALRCDAMGDLGNPLNNDSVYLRLVDSIGRYYYANFQKGFDGYPTSTFSTHTLYGGVSYGGDTTGYISILPTDYFVVRSDGTDVYIDLYHSDDTLVTSYLVAAGIPDPVNWRFEVGYYHQFAGSIPVTGLVAKSGTTLLDITGIADGGSGVLIIEQDAGGGFDLSFPLNSIFIDNENLPITLTKDPFAVDALQFVYDGTNFYWTSWIDPQTGSIVDTNFAANSILANATGSTAPVTGVTLAANKFLARSSTGNLAAKTITDFGLSLVDDADAAAGRSTLSLGALAVENAITLTGDVTGSGSSSFAATIASHAVTLPKLAQIATASFLGRSTSGTGDVEVIGTATVKTMLSLNLVENTALSTWPGTTNITTLGTVSTGTWSATTIAINKGGTGQTTANAALNALLPSQAGNSGKVLTTDATDASWTTLIGLIADGDKGDITVSGSGTVFSIDAGAVGLSQMANVASGSVFYRKTAGSGVPEVQTLATLKTDLGLTGTNSGDQTITLTGDVTGSGTGSFAATIATNAVTLTKMAQIATASFLGRSTAGTGNVEVLGVSGVKTMLSLNLVENTALSTWAGSANITTLGTIGTGTWNAGTIAISRGGTGQTTANAALNALLPSQTSNSGQYLQTNGTDTSWQSAWRGTVSDGYLPVSDGSYTFSDSFASQIGGVFAISGMPSAVFTLNNSNSIISIGDVNNAQHGTLLTIDDDGQTISGYAANGVSFEALNQSLQLNATDIWLVFQNIGLQISEIHSDWDIILGDVGSGFGYTTGLFLELTGGILTATGETQANIKSPIVNIGGSGSVVTIGDYDFGGTSKYISFDDASGIINSNMDISANGFIGVWGGNPINVTHGGTDIISYAVGDILYASGTITLAKLAGVATGNALISGGVGTAPSWGKIGLTTHVSGTLAVGSGGTGITSFGSGVATWLGTPTSTNLRSAVATSSEGTGSLVFHTSPNFATAVNMASGGAYQYNTVNVVRAITANNTYLFGNSGLSTLANNTGTENLGIGNAALGGTAGANVSGGNNVAVGNKALEKLTTGIRNVAVGWAALGSLTTQSNNVAVGYGVLFGQTGGSANTGLGYFAMGNAAMTGSDNNAFGANALLNITSGGNNAAFGSSSQVAVTTASRNTGFGRETLATNTKGSGNVAIGHQAGFTLNDTSGSTENLNVFIGSWSGYSLTTGKKNTILGAGTNNASTSPGITTGDANTLIGANIASVGNISNNIVIADGDGVQRINVASNGNVGIGLPAASAEPTVSAKLHIVKSTEQLRIGVDVSNYYSTTVNATGGVTFDAVGSGAGFTFADSVTHADATNLIFGTSAGSKIGTATSQLIGFWNATPIAQPTTAVAAATFVAGAGTAVNDASTFDGYTLKQIVKALRNAGLLA